MTAAHHNPAIPTYYPLSTSPILARISLALHLITFLIILSLYPVGMWQWAFLTLLVWHYFYVQRHYVLRQSPIAITALYGPYRDSVQNSNALNYNKKCFKKCWDLIQSDGDEITSKCTHVLQWRLPSIIAKDAICFFIIFQLTNRQSWRFSRSRPLFLITDSLDMRAQSFCKCLNFELY